MNRTRAAVLRSPIAAVASSRAAALGFVLLLVGGGVAYANGTGAISDGHIAAPSRRRMPAILRRQGS